MNKEIEKIIETACYAYAGSRDDEVITQTTSDLLALFEERASESEIRKVITITCSSMSVYLADDELTKLAHAVATSIKRKND